MFADLRWVNIQNLGEAFKLLQYGNRNRSAAATKMNQSSSRRQVGLLCFFFLFLLLCKSDSSSPLSHSIFTIKLLKIEEAAVKWLSE